MEVTNIKYHPDLPFSEYLKLSGTSFSGLKDSKAPDSPAIRLGTYVHRYILQPDKYNYEMADVVIPIANELITFVGTSLLRTMRCETAITANFEYLDFSFNWKGIPDMSLTKNIVIDFKVIDGDIEKYCDYFNYPSQLRGYMKAESAQVGLILAFNKRKRNVQKKIILPDDRWWEQIILTRGHVKNNS